MIVERERRTLVFIDDAHTLGGAQIALAWCIRALIRKTVLTVVCVCPRRTRGVVDSVVGPSERLAFIDCPSALPFNILSFPVRIGSFIRIVRRLRRNGVFAWWLNLSGIEFCLAPLSVLGVMGEDHGAWLHCVERFGSFFPRGSTIRKMLCHIRDTLADNLLFRFHPVMATPSKVSSELLRKRIGLKRLEAAIPHLYPPLSLTETQDAGEAAHNRPPVIHMWLIGRVEFGSKNCPAALDTLETLLKRGLQATLTVVGDGPDMPRLQRLAGPWTASGAVKLSGWQENPWLAVGSSDIVLIPSFYESLSLVAVEAMLRGVRLVTGPLPVFSEGVPADFIAKGFSGEMLADQVEHVSRIIRSEVRRQYSEALTKFSEDHFLDAFMALTASVAGDDRI